jgi:fumarate reductase subunit C
MPTTWWLRNPRYFLYMLREVTSIFVFLYALAFAVQFFLLADRGMFDAFRALFTSPVFRAFTGVVLVMAVVHGITWWSLNARVFQIRLAGRPPLPPVVLFAGGVLAWIVVSGVVYFLIFRGI